MMRPLAGLSNLRSAGGDPGQARQAYWERAEGQRQLRGRYSAGGRGGRILDPGLQNSQRGGASLPGGHLPAAQYQQGRDGLGLEPPGDLR